MAKYKLITCAKEFSSLAEQWNDLYQRSNTKTVFQSYDWNFQWYLNAHTTDKLFIILMFNQSPNSLDTIFPFVIDKNKTLRFIGDIHSDYSNFLIADDVTSRLYELFRMLKKIIAESKDITSIELKNITQHNPFIGLLSFMFDFKQTIFNTNGFSSISIKSKEDFWSCFGYLNSKGRNELKRVCKKNEFLNSKLYKISLDEFPSEKIMTLFNTMVLNGSRDIDYFNKSFFKIIENMYNSGHLHVYEVYKEDKSLAIKLILKGAENVHIFWIDLFNDMNMINIFSYIEYVRTVCNNEDKEFTLDFGRGLYNYKVKNFQPNIGQQYTFFYSKSNSKFIFYTFKYALKASLKNFYKKNKTLINKILRR